MGDEEWRKLPLPERVVSKVWKCRNEAYPEVAKLFKTTDESGDFQEYASVVDKFPKDTNAVAQAQGVAAALAFAEHAPVDLTARHAKNLAEGCVTKCFANMKAKEGAKDLCLMLIEIGAGEEVVEQLIAGFKHRVVGKTSDCVAV